MNISGRLAGAIFSVATFLAACGSDSGSSVDAPKTPDSPAIVDASIDAAIDAPPQGACASVSCFLLDPGSSPTPITTHPKTEDPPTLTGIGSNSLDGDYTLTAVDVYPKGTFSNLVTTAEVSDHGGTNGTGRFAADSWGYYLNFDIHYNIVALSMMQMGDATQTLRGGGCFTLSGATLTSETGRCDEGWPQGATVPNSYQVQYDGSVAKLKITLPKEFIIGLIPPANQQIAALAITGPIVFLLTFQHNTPL